MKADQKQRRRSCGRRPLQISRARDFRKTTTEVEEGAWHLLRGFREDGFAFRRQHPIGMYIVDFCCPGELLIVEMDGSIHAQASQVRHDTKRDECLRAMGYTVLRISNGVVQAAPGDFWLA